MRFGHVRAQLGLNGIAEECDHLVVDLYGVLARVSLAERLGLEGESTRDLYPTLSVALTPIASDNVIKNSEGRIHTTKVEKNAAPEQKCLRPDSTDTWTWIVPEAFARGLEYHGCLV